MRILLAGLVMMFAIGCAKKSAKKTEPTRDEYANRKPLQPQQPAPNPKVNDPKKDKQGDTADEYNWVQEKQPKDSNQLPVNKTDKQGYGGATVPPGAVVPVPTPGVQPVPQPGAGGVTQPVNPPAGGVAQPVPAAPPTGGTPGKSGKRAEVADMKEIWAFIEGFSAPGGIMPSIPLVTAALEKEKSPAAALVKDGTIVLTGSTKRESIWAYEYDARKNGGLVVSQNGVETLTAAELNRRLQP